MQINRWWSFKDQGTFFTLGWLLLKFAEFLFLELFLCFSGSICFSRSQIFNIEVWNFDTGVQKNIFCFYSILSETFSNSCRFAVYRNLIFSFFTLHFIIGNIFVQSWLICVTFHTASHQKFLLLSSDLKKCSRRTLSKNAAVR